MMPSFTYAFTLLWVLRATFRPSAPRATSLSLILCCLRHMFRRTEVHLPAFTNLYDSTPEGTASQKTASD